jgi:hypothetical protein
MKRDEEPPTEDKENGRLTERATPYASDLRLMIEKFRSACGEAAMAASWGSINFSPRQPLPGERPPCCGRKWPPGPRTLSPRQAVFDHVKGNDDALRTPIARNRAAELGGHASIEELASVPAFTDR